MKNNFWTFVGFGIFYATLLGLQSAFLGFESAVISGIAFTLAYLVIIVEKK